MKKMNKEFEELMFTKTEGRMIEQLTVSIGDQVLFIDKHAFLGTGLLLGHFYAHHSECYSC